MLRFHFTDRDLARVHLATAPDPLWETVLGVHKFGAEGRRAPVFWAWRERARAEVHERGLRGPLSLLHALVAPPGYFPDFLTPAESGDGLRAGLDALRHTPPARMRREVRLMAQERDLSSGVRNLLSGDRCSLDEIGEAARLVHNALVAPEWTGVRARFDADRAVRTRALRDGGTEGLLRSLRPVLHWDPPVLHARYPVDADVHLGGRGLRLVPSYFCWHTPVALADPELPPVVVYPVSHDLVRPRPGGLAPLLGRTRALVLHTVDDVLTTGELARKLRISAAAVSRHTAVLRDAGLISSRREANLVCHTLTPLGRALLREAGGPGTT